LTASNPVAVSEALPAFAEDTATQARPSPVMSAILAKNSSAGEQLRLLASRLRTLGRERPLRTVGVVSATPGEGKTTVAIGLARAFAGRERVLLVEADLRRPAVDETLGFAPPRRGVFHHLAGGTGALVIRRLAESSRCWVLSAGEGTFSEPEVLASPRMTALLESATRSFDHVVLDCPPLLTVADAVLLQDHIDGFVFVLRSRHAPREAVLRATSVLKPGAILGTVFNDQRDIVVKYNYSYYDRPAKPQRPRSRKSR
jgi:Mrp family chromosome partitioning ATPase